MRRNLQLLISEEFAEKTIPENDSVRLADDMIDKLDLKCLFCTYLSNGRKYATRGCSQLFLNFGKTVQTGQTKQKQVHSIKQYLF